MEKYPFLTLVALALSFASCKKDRTCECTFTTISQTSTQPGYTFTPPPPQTSSTKYTKIKKNSDPVKNCVTNERTSTYSSQVFDGSNPTPTFYTVTQVTKNDCKIK